jgi:heme oxygenase (biliverdin-IX-beta and delta-forming)
MSIRFALKSATDPLHEELDAALSRLNLGDRADYARFLKFNARTVPVIEAELAAGGIGEMVEGWNDARRSTAIERDLAELGEAMPEPAPAPPIEGPAALLGTAYVLEGSRLGGQVLQRRIGEGLPAHFLNHPSGVGPWKGLIAVLESHLYSDALIGEAKDAARRCFAWFLHESREAGI